MGTINIAVVTDNNVVGQLAVTIKSILANKKNEDDIHFFYVETGLSNENKDYIRRIVTEGQSIIDFFEAPEEYLNIVNNARVKVVYCYCFLHEILPVTVGKVLLVESDMIILDSLSDLFNMNIDEYYIAAADDMQSKWYKEKIGMNKDEMYFNSGVMLMNLDKMRRDSITKKIIKVLKSGDSICGFDVQDELNVAYGGEVKKIPPKYNFTASFIPYNYENMKRYRKPSTCCTEEEFNEAKIAPIIIHYTRSQLMQPKPWLTPCDHPYKGEWIKYRDMTVLKEESLKPAKTTSKRKMVSIIYRYFPLSVSASMLGIVRAYLYPKYLYKIIKHN